MFAISRNSVKGKKQIVAVAFEPSVGADGSQKVSKDRGAGGAVWLVGRVPESKRDWFAQAQFASFPTIEDARNAIPQAEAWYALYDAAVADRKVEKIVAVPAAQE